MISGILPPGVRAAEAYADLAGAALFPAEEAAMAGASTARRAEFATARACARTALAALGVPAAAILPGPCGEPRWPAGFTGSITHCAGYRGCAVGSSGLVAALGIDAEPNRPLPPGVLDDVAVAADRGWLAGGQPAAAQVCWDRLLFSAKESAYKAWFSLTGRRLRFEDAAIAADPAGGRLAVRLQLPAAAGPGPAAARLAGRWLVADGLILTAIAIPA